MTRSIRLFPALMLCAFLVPVLHAQAQITFTRSDFDKILAAPFVTIASADAVQGTRIDVGNTGASSAVDLSALAFTELTLPQMYVPAAQTPYAMDFPTATHAAQTEVQGVSGYMFLRVAADGVYSLGMAGEVSGNPIIVHYDPEQLMIRLPLSLGQNWAYNGNPSSPVPGVTYQTTSTTNVDAAGTLQTPRGSYPFLRMKTVSFETTKIEFGGQVIAEDVVRSVEYMYLTKDKVVCTITIDSTSENDQFALAESIDISYAGTTTSVDGESPRARGLTLDASYPNPVSAGAATVTWTSSAARTVRVTIHDVTGREIATAYEGPAMPGSTSVPVDVSGLETGMYLLRISDGTSSAHTRLNVIK